MRTTVDTDARLEQVAAANVTLCWLQVSRSSQCNAILRLRMARSGREKRLEVVDGDEAATEGRALDASTGHQRHKYWNLAACGRHGGGGGHQHSTGWGHQPAPGTRPNSGRISTRRWPSPAANGPRGAAAVPCLASPVVKLASSSILLLPASHRQRAASIGGVLLAAFIRTRYLVIVSEIQITSAGSYVLPVTTPSGKNGRLVASTPSWTW